VSLEFQCGQCLRLFENAWTEEEARAEADLLLGEDILARDGDLRVCEDCFDKMFEDVPSFPPARPLD